MFLPEVTPPRADSRISNVRLGGAAVMSVYLGWGAGHAIIGHSKAGRIFRQTQGWASSVRLEVEQNQLVGEVGWVGLGPTDVQGA